MQTPVTLESIKFLVLEAGGFLTRLETISYSDDLFDFGYTSISIVNLIELLESTYGVYVEPEKNIKRLNSIGNIYQVLLEQDITSSNRHYS